MAYSYTEKAVVSGSHVEIFRYKNPVWADFTPTKQQRKYKQSELPLSQRSTRRSLNRARTSIRRYLNTNPQLNKFLTLTFAENVTDLKRANYLFNQFIKRLEYNFPGVDYLAVPEFQKRGAVHYHLVINLDYKDSDTLGKIWGHGFIKINKLDNVSNVGAYVCKYLSKEDDRFYNKKKFFRSRGLLEPVELIGRYFEIFFRRFVENLTPEFSTTFKGEYNEVEYNAYFLGFFPFPGGFTRDIVKTYQMC